MPRRFVLATGFGLLTACGGGSSPSVLDLPDGELYPGYPAGSVEWVLLEAAPTLAPLSPTGEVLGFVVSPPLPLGLVLDPQTGEIGGAPQAIVPPTEYSITAFSETEKDTETVTLEVRAPVVTLISSAPLVRSIATAGNPVASTPALLTPIAAAPTATDLATVIVDAPLAATATIVLPGPPPTAATEPAVPPHIATEDFVATITVESAELEAQPWQLNGVAPYVALTGSLPSVNLDTAQVPLSEGSLALSLSLPTPPVTPFATESTPTLLRTSQALTANLSSTSRDAAAVGGHLYFVASTDLVHQDLHRFDPATPALHRLTDVQASGGIFTTLSGSFGDWVVYESDLGLGIEKPFLHDTSTGTTAQISDLNPVGSDGAGSFTRLGDELFFVGGPSFLQRHLYRYRPAADLSPASLERVSFTADDGNDAPAHPTVHDGQVYFTALHAGTSERHLYRFDPTSGTQERLSSSAQANVANPRSIAGELFVSARGSGGATKLHRFDSAGDNLVQLTNLVGDPSISDSIQFLDGSVDRLFFEARTPAGIRKLFCFDPSNQTLVQVSDSAGSGASDGILELLDTGDAVYFAARNASGSTKLFCTDLPTNEQFQVCDANGPELDDGPCDFILRSNGTLALAMDLDATGGFSLLEVPLDGSTPQILGDPFGALEQDDVAPLIEWNGEFYYAAGPADARVLYTLDS